MSSPYTVALIFDSDFGDRLQLIAARIHTWAIDSPANRLSAEKLWASLPQPFSYNNESGVSLFSLDLGENPNGWCDAILDTIDQHHDEMSHIPCYSVLEVYGLQFDENLRLPFVTLGFSIFEETSYGFRAIKS